MSRYSDEALRRCSKASLIEAEALVSCDGLLLQAMPSKARAHRDVVLAAVAQVCVLLSERN